MRRQTNQVKARKMKNKVPTKPREPDDLDAKPPEEGPPDKRGPRPTDPNELAKWIVEQSTNDANEDPRKDE